MRLALFQMQAVAGDVATNLQKIEGAARQAAESGADLLITPELSIPGYGADDKMATLADREDGPQIKKLQAISRDNKIALIAGFAEQDGQSVYNSAVFLDGDNTPVIYRKSHLYGSYEKSHFQTCGAETTLFEVKGKRCGMLICYDVEFPENVRRLAQAEVDLVIVPTALPISDHGPFIARKLVPTRAFENQVIVAYANHTGRDDLFAYQGLSTIAAPDGTMLAVADETEETVLFADIDLGRYVQSRLDNSYLEDL